MTRVRAEAALDAAAPAVAALAVIAAAAGSSIQYDILRVGRPARWLALALLVAFACARLFLRESPARFSVRTAVALAAFCGLSLVSVVWSVNPHGSLERAVGQVAVVAALGALAACAVGSPRLGRGLLAGVLAGAAAVAFAGFVYWLIDPSRAAIVATAQYPSRYQGIEQNPNTAPLLLAIAMPIAFWSALRAVVLWRRLAYTLLALVFVASISASGSRGGLLASVIALLVVAALAPLPRARRVALAAGAVAVIAVAAWAMTIPKAAIAPVTPVASPSQTRNADRVLPLDGEIGNPWWTHRSGAIHRTLFGTSVRLRALRGAIGQAEKRPLLGYGFGAEQWAFVNRYYGFSSQNPEDGYAGLMLQLGLVGLALWVAVLLLAIVPAAARLVRDRDGRAHPYALGALSGSVAAAVMGLSQSYFHAPGGIGYIALWTVLLLASSARVPKTASIR